MTRRDCVLWDQHTGNLGAVEADEPQAFCRVPQLVLSSPVWAGIYSPDKQTHFECNIDARLSYYGER